MVGALTYANSLAAPFIFDDLASIQRNDTIRRLSNFSTLLVPPRETPVAGRPIPNLSLAVNYALGGFDVAGYHLWNVAVHLAAALVLFGIVRRTLVGSRLGAEGARAANAVALVSALLWAVHPIQTEVVDYVTQRTESMMGLFLFLTLYCAIRARRSAHATWWEAASVLACLLGMGSKESMATAPILVLLYDRVFEFDSMPEAVRTRWRLYAALAATWIALAALMSMTPRSTIGTSSGTGVWLYLLNQLEMIVAYLRLVIWPKALVADYGVPRMLALGDVIPEAVVVISLLLATGVALARWPKIGFLGAAFFLTLAPTTSLIPISTEVGAERRMYVPFAALAVLLVLAGRWVLQRVAARSGIRPSVLQGTVVAAVLLALATRTIYRNAEYVTPLTLWRTSVERRPQGRARSLLASQLLEAGRHDEAMIELRLAVRDYPTARFALGAELYGQGKFDEAITELGQLTASLPGHPSFALAEQLIGRALEAQGKLPDAAAQFQRIVDRNPSNPGAHGFLADVLFSQKRFGEAIPHYRALLAAQPDIPTALGKLALSLASVGRLDEAIADFRRLAEVDPHSPATQRNLAQAFLQQRNAAQAELYAREAIRLAPADPIAHSLLADARGLQGDMDGAIDHFRQALELSPNDPNARDGLARALRARNRRSQP